MFGKIRSIFQRRNPLLEDARKLYYANLKQARLPEFFGENAVTDDYDGRIDLLTLHLSALLHTLRRHGEQGALLSQAIFDVMKDDFEIAMREEGLSDSGIKRRIKPMIKLFYDRLKKYSEAFDASDTQIAVQREIQEGLLEKKSAAVSASLTEYVMNYHSDLLEIPIVDIAQNPLPFPALGLEK